MYDTADAALSAPRPALEAPKHTERSVCKSLDNVGHHTHATTGIALFQKYIVD